MDSLNGHSMLPMIFSYLPIEDVCRCLKVNSDFNHAIENNWKTMQREKTAIVVIKQKQFCDVLFSLQWRRDFYFGDVPYFDRTKRSENYKIRITDSEICFPPELEGLAWIISRERNMIPEHSRLLTSLEVASNVEGQRDVLKCLIKRFDIHTFRISPLYYQRRNFSTYACKCEDFTPDELVCYYDWLKKAEITKFSSDRAEYGPQLVAIHRLIRGIGRIECSVLAVDDSILTLDTRHSISIRCVHWNRSPFEKMIKEWMAGKRIISLLDVRADSFHPEHKEIADVPEDLTKLTKMFAPCLHDHVTNRFGTFVLLKKSRNEFLKVYFFPECVSLEFCSVMPESYGMM